MSKRPFIGVVGEQECAPEMAALAERVGEALARRGAVLVCGGMGGVMEAAARGAKRAGGLTVGILPGAHRSSANPFIDVPIVTNLGEARNSIVVRSAQAIVAVGGSYGTLSEIAFALKLGIPVVGLATWRLDKDGHGREGFQDPIVRVSDPETAVETALRLATQYPETIP
ncbi:TIGR00725 family protein [Carboxydochorda subterranea]|uniref:TIGR00725 family protein n=1 Tax=Carboxydichorda subterranea TaxID=3109565 RepID=A0ABZ1BUT7_9FIRM|nr:TIGR00725 family protein [Limnochorda sp. L945t]WRP16291.1 TIGR00725 family protein [Limnochorda sp. L945t]